MIYPDITKERAELYNTGLDKTDICSVQIIFRKNCSENG